MKKKTLILIVAAILLAAALVLLIVIAAGGRGGDKSSAYAYSYKTGKASLRFSADRGGAEGCEWYSETSNDELIAVEKETGKKKDVFTVTADESLETGSLTFTLASVDNPFNRIYRIYLAFERDGSGALTVTSDRYEALEPVQGGGETAELPYSLRTNPDGSIGVFIPSKDGRNDIWYFNADPGIGVNGPESGESGLLFTVVPQFNDNTELAGSHTVELYDTERMMVIRLIVASDSNGVLAIDSHSMAPFEGSDSSAEDAGKKAFTDAYGDISVPDAALRKYDTGLWTIRSVEDGGDGENEGTKPYGSLFIDLGENVYFLCVSDEATLEEFSLDSSTWAESEKSITVAGTPGMYYVNQSQRTAVWEKDGRVYNLSSKTASEEDIITLAGTICK